MSTPYGPADPESASETDAPTAKKPSAKASSAKTPSGNAPAAKKPAAKKPAAAAATTSDPAAATTDPAAAAASAPVAAAPSEAGAAQAADPGVASPTAATEAERPVVVVPPVESAGGASSSGTYSSGASSSEPTPAAQTYYRPSVPSSDNQMIMRPTSRVHGILRGGIAVLLVIAGVVNLFWGGRFPSNAPVEQIFVFGISVDMFAAAIVLGIFAILAVARRSVPVKPRSTSPMSVAAVAMAGLVFLAWALLNLLPVLGSVSAGERYQYMTAVGAIFILGIPWALSLIFGTLSLRSGGRLTLILGTIAIALGFLLVIAAVTSSVLYGLGLTD